MLLMTDVLGGLSTSIFSGMSDVEGTGEVHEGNLMSMRSTLTISTSS